MSEGRWRVVVFTDEDGGEFYRLNIQAEDAETAERNAMAEAQLVFALLRPLVNVLWVHAQPNERSDNDGSS
jgi:hypothetical protein